MVKPYAPSLEFFIIRQRFHVLFPFMGIHIPILGFTVLIDYISPLFLIVAPKRLNKWIRKGFVEKHLPIVFQKALSIAFGSVD